MSGGFPPRRRNTLPNGRLNNRAIVDLLTPKFEHVKRTRGLETVLYKFNRLD